MDSTKTPKLKVKLDEEVKRSAVITVTSWAVQLAFLDAAGRAVDVREFSTRENPELRMIYKLDAFFDCIWDMDIVLSLLDDVDPDAPIGELMPLVPAYLESIGVAV